MQLVRTRWRAPRDLGAAMPHRRLPPRRADADALARARRSHAEAGARADNEFAAQAAHFLDWREKQGRP